MRFSVWPNPARPTSEILDLAQFVDDAGWHGMWFADHYMPNTGSEVIQPGDVHECWAILPAIAAVTERIRIGSLVAPTSVHHPAVLGQPARTRAGPHRHQLGHLRCGVGGDALTRRSCWSLPGPQPLMRWA